MPSMVCHKATMNDIGYAGLTPAGDFPRDTVASALEKKTLMLTIHSLEKTGFDRLAENLKELGAHVEV